MARNNYDERLKFVNDLCNKNMDVFDEINNIYDLEENDDPSIEGYGFKFVGNKDNFQPIINVRFFVDSSNTDITVFIDNRNGNNIVYGNTIATYELKIDYKENMSEEETARIDKNYKKIMQSIIDKWTIYSKDNILGYIEEKEIENFNL